MLTDLEIGDTIKVAKNSLDICKRKGITVKGIEKYLGKEFTVLDLNFDEIWFVSILSGVYIPLVCCNKI